ncbi:hypothetical protein R1flu_020763 [Riccia fluitans]|uniref:Chalcone synthase n=1 Tax=Riccia fluitans TaxID=41844 RepID=A0ABD1ZMF0_9MARC
MGSFGESIPMGTSSKQPGPGKATVLAIGRAVPTMVVHQEGMAERYLRDINRIEEPGLLAKLERLCTNTTVKTRYTVITEEVIRNNPGFLVEGATTVRERLKISADEVTKLGVEAATKALAEWNRPLEEITHLVYVSSSEVRLPGGDLYIAASLGLRKTVSRVMLYMLGCCGGAAGIRVAKDLAENNPGSRVLLTTSDNCLIGYRAPHPDRPYDLVGAALFGDGAAAMIIGADPVPGKETPWFEFHQYIQTFVPGTEQTIDGTLNESGIIFTLSRELPKVIENNIEEFAEALQGELPKDLKYNDIFWAVHPGGPAILNAVEKKLELTPEKLTCSRQVLSDYGNINSNTIIYVLDYMRQASLKKRAEQSTDSDPEWGFMLAFGPGITVEGMVARNLV